MGKIFKFLKNAKIYNYMIKNAIIENLIDYFHKKYDKLYKIAKEYDYETFLDKTDNLVYLYTILYRGGEMSNDSFFTDYIGHAKEYSDDIDGIIINEKDILFFNDNIFEELKKIKYNKSELKQIYAHHIKNGKMDMVMSNKHNNIDKVINFVYNFITSEILFSSIEKNHMKRDFLIPMMLDYAKNIGKNIISFVGGDYGEYDGQNEFVVHDISKYPKLSDIYKEANKGL